MEPWASVAKRQRMICLVLLGLGIAGSLLAAQSKMTTIIEVWFKQQLPLVYSLLDLDPDS